MRIALWALCAASGFALAADLTDHHQHLFSPAVGAISSIGPKGIDAGDLIAAMDTAGIRRAVVLSVAYMFANPNKPRHENEYALVKAENDWTSQQVAYYPERLIGFCSVNPLAAYALEEIDRCARDPNLRTGLKLHFGNSDVDVTNPDHQAKVRRVFRAANGHRMAIVVHMRPSVDRQRPYGASHARAFLEQVLPEAPDVIVQIAHLAGSGGYDDAAIDEAVQVFADAIAKGDPRMRNVYFDVSGVAGLGDHWAERAPLAAQRMRQLGVRRLLYGCDAAAATNQPADFYKRWRTTPLSEEEFRTVESNVAPYLRK